MDAVTPTALFEEAKPRPRRPSRRLLSAMGAGALAIAGTAWIVAPATAETTDDAYISADATSVAPKVRGLVATVLVSDNQPVRAGQPLLVIDDEEFEARRLEAEAALADAQSRLAEKRAELAALDAEIRLAGASVIAAGTTIRSAEEETHRATLDRLRFEQLFERGFATRRDTERVRATAVAAEQELARSRALLGVAREGTGVTRARRPVLEAAVRSAKANVAKARAAVDLARQDHRHATVLAPIDGVVANRQARVGDYVAPGTRLLTVVPLHDLYITANFKETQTERMRPGQRVTIDVDALSGEALAGRVESIAPGSGSTFSLLPFEPGTGNFTKIVQRVPVRIRFDSRQPRVERLRPGLSVTATVHLD
jgi:membrane fusion protein (multidrug efflux system)